MALSLPVIFLASNKISETLRYVNVERFLNVFAGDGNMCISYLFFSRMGTYKLLEIYTQNL